ncbi:MAG: MerR family DNA-binding protein [Shimia sp.]
MCAKFDVTPRTLRYYEYIELLSPDRDGRTRRYGPREVARMTLILRGRRWGFPLEDIRQWLLIRDKDGDAPQMRAFVALADSQLESLRAQQTELEATITELEQLRGEVAREVGAE